MDGDVELVGALDEIEALDREDRLRIAEDALGLQLFDVGVRPVAADALGVEDADPDDEVLDRDRRAKPEPDVERLAAVEDVRALAVAARSG